MFLQRSKPECNLTNLMTTPSDRRKAGCKSGGLESVQVVRKKLQ